MSSAPELLGLRALVTGGTKGVGKAVVARLREAGANVLTTARSRPDELAEERFIGADITTAEGCKAIVDAVLERFGGVDIVVHVVGGSSAPAGGFSVLDDDEWNKALSLNLFPAVRIVSGKHMGIPGSLRRQLDCQRLEIATGCDRTRVRDTLWNDNQVARADLALFTAQPECALS